MKFTKIQRIGTLSTSCCFFTVYTYAYNRKVTLPTHYFWHILFSFFRLWWFMVPNFVDITLAWQIIENRKPNKHFEDLYKKLCQNLYTCNMWDAERNEVTVAFLVSAYYTLWFLWVYISIQHMGRYKVSLPNKRTYLAYYKHVTVGLAHRRKLMTLTLHNCSIFII